MQPAEIAAYQRTADPKELRSVMVNRLSRLVCLQNDLRDDLNPTGVEMLDRAIYSTYRDCLDLGAEDEALPLMARYDALAPREG